jgi:hypothetical protein
MLKTPLKNRLQRFRRLLPIHHAPSAITPLDFTVLEPLEPRVLLSGTLFVVNSLQDVVATDGLITLREAIEAANTNTAVHNTPAGSDTATDVITFDIDALQNEAGPGAPLEIVLAETHLTISDNLNILGPVAQTLTIDANHFHGAFSIADIPHAEINNLTITGADERRYSKAIWHTHDGTLTLNNVNLTGNSIGLGSNIGHTMIQGANIHNNAFEGITHSLGTLTITNSSIHNNTNGIDIDQGTADITHSTISHNSSRGIFHEGGTVNISHSVISHNSVGYYATEGQPSTLSNSDIHDNYTGIFLEETSSLTVTDSIIRLNNTGAQTYLSSNLDLINSTIASNQRGISNTGLSTTTITNSIITANSAGAIYNASTLLINNTTITHNSNHDQIYYPESSGIYNDFEGHTMLYNTILKYNFLGVNDQGPDFHNPEGHIDFNATHTGILPHFIRNPSPGDDGAWGTPDDDLGDLRLQSNSPAIDAGDNALLPADDHDLDGDGDTLEPLPRDLANKDRVNNNTVDIGAYEYHPYIPGDLNGDESIDLADTDLMSYVLNTTNPTHFYDLNADNNVNALDGQHLVENILHTRRADFNLDGVVSVADLITWASNFGTGDAYSRGDANFDGQTTVADLILWATNFSAAPSAPPLSQSSAAVAEEPLPLIDPSLDTNHATANTTSNFIAPTASPTDRWDGITSLLHNDVADKDKNKLSVLDVIDSV